MILKGLHFFRQRGQKENSVFVLNLSMIHACLHFCLFFSQNLSLQIF